MSPHPAPPPAGRRPPGKPPRRPPGGPFDVLVARAARAGGLVVGLVEVWLAQALGREVDVNVLLFAAMLLGLPLALGGGNGRGDG